MTLHSSELTQVEPLVDVVSNQELKESPSVSGTAPAILSIEAFCGALNSCRSCSSVYLSVVISVGLLMVHIVKC